MNMAKTYTTNTQLIISNPDPPPATKKNAINVANGSWRRFNLRHDVTPPSLKSFPPGSSAETSGESVLRKCLHSAWPSSDSEWLLFRLFIVSSHRKVHSIYVHVHRVRVTLTINVCLSVLSLITSTFVVVIGIKDARVGLGVIADVNF